MYIHADESKINAAPPPPPPILRQVHDKGERATHLKQKIRSFRRRFLEIIHCMYSRTFIFILFFFCIRKIFKTPRTQRCNYTAYM
jgi:hypothetical protein